MNRICLTSFLIYPGLMTIIMMLIGETLAVIVVLPALAALSGVQFFPWLSLSYVLIKFSKTNIFIRFFMPLLASILINFTWTQIIFNDPSVVFKLQVPNAIASALSLWYYNRREQRKSSLNKVDPS